MDAKTFQTLAIGDIITYTLATDQRPTNPHRAYKGIVKRIDHKAQRVIVTLLDEVYEALCEPVGMGQIQSVAKPYRSVKVNEIGNFH
jgi:hypothetical protein